MGVIAIDPVSVIVEYQGHKIFNAVYTAFVIDLVTDIITRITKMAVTLIDYVNSFKTDIDLICSGIIIVIQIAVVIVIRKAVIRFENNTGTVVLFYPFRLTDDCYLIFI